MKTILKAYLISALTIIGILLISFNAFGATADRYACNSGFKGFLNIFLPKKVELQCNISVEYLDLLDRIKDLKNELTLGSVTETALTDTIGTFRTNVNNDLLGLDRDLRFTTTTDPGHKHTTSTITGTSSVASGGTGKGSFTKGLVTASGTDAFSTLQTGGDGAIPISSGTDWVAKTITAGSNITITNGSGSVSIAGVAAASMGILGSSTLVADAASTTVSFTAKKNLLVYLYASTTGNVNRVVDFNADNFSDGAGAAYATRGSENQASAFNNTSQGNINLNETVLTGNGSSTLSVLEIANPIGRSKAIIGNTTAAGLADNVAEYIGSFEFYGLWATTTQISRIDFSATTGVLGTGSYILVFGSD